MDCFNAVINFNNDHLSLIEISHRSKPFVEVMKKAQNLVRDLLNIPDEYSVLFLQGGASLEFLMVPFNLLKINGTAGYLNTGSWSQKAIDEAKALGKVSIVGDSSNNNYNYIPKNYERTRLHQRNSICAGQFNKDGNPFC